MEEVQNFSQKNIVFPVFTPLLRDLVHGSHHPIQKPAIACVVVVVQQSADGAASYASGFVEAVAALALPP